jgi:hypothetical protein
VDVGPDVPAVRNEPGAGVHADANGDRPGRELGLRLLGGRQRGRGFPERGEERVALRVDLDAAVRFESLTEDTPVVGERVGVALGTELVEQARRALDVAEEEGDRAGREPTLSQEDSIADNAPFIRDFGFEPRGLSQTLPQYAQQLREA